MIYTSYFGNLRNLPIHIFPEEDMEWVVRRMKIIDEILFGNVFKAMDMMPHVLKHRIELCLV